jgi:hypothetical protein
MNPAVAESCTYTLKRGSKKIVGPSARFAEIISHAWGNARFGARVVAEDAEFVVAQGAFSDLETNTSITFETRRRIVDSDGVRFNLDMVMTTSNAAASIALRNAILKAIPKALWEPLWQEAQKVARGDASTLVKRRTDMFTKFASLGVKPEEIYTVLEVKGQNDIDLDALMELGGLYTAIADGDASVESVFRTKRVTHTADESINEKLGITEDDKKQKAKPAEAEKKPAEEKK